MGGDVDRSKCESKIVNSFRKQVQGDSSLRSAFLLVQSDISRIAI